MKWHRAHTTWFFEEFLLTPPPRYEPVDPVFRFLFNSYYETIGERHPRAARGQVTRPGVGEVADYRAHVDAQVSALLTDGARDHGALDHAALDLAELGCHHEQQHQELLLADVKHLFSGNAADPVYVPRALEPEPQAAPHPVTWTPLTSGLHLVGHDGPDFAFDNERPQHRVWLEDVEIASRQVTNAQWLEFVDDGGYTRPCRRLRQVGRGATAHGGEVGGRDASRPRIDGGLLDVGRCHPLSAGDATLGDVWEWTSSGRRVQRQVHERPARVARGARSHLKRTPG